MRNSPVTDTANSPANAKKSPERSVARAPGSRQPATQEDEHTGEHQHRGDVEGVEDQPTHDALGIEVNRPDVRQVHLVAVSLLADAFEVEQPKRQGES